jgi:inhibitor of cysteine peptidase
MTTEYNRQHTAIKARPGDEFVIALDANPTTGYQWVPRFDADALQLLERQPPSVGPGIGAGGVERFRFKTTGTRASPLVFVYQRPWDTAPAEVLTFQLEPD